MTNKIEYTTARLNEALEIGDLFCQFCRFDNNLEDEETGRPTEFALKNNFAKIKDHTILWSESTRELIVDNFQKSAQNFFNEILGFYKTNPNKIHPTFFKSLFKDFKKICNDETKANIYHSLLQDNIAVEICEIFKLEEFQRAYLKHNLEASLNPQKNHKQPKL